MRELERLLLGVSLLGGITEADASQVSLQGANKSQSYDLLCRLSVTGHWHLPSVFSECRLVDSRMRQHHPHPVSCSDGPREHCRAHDDQISNIGRPARSIENDPC